MDVGFNFINPGLDCLIAGLGRDIDLLDKRKLLAADRARVEAVMKLSHGSLQLVCPRSGFTTSRTSAKISAGCDIVLAECVACHSVRRPLTSYFQRTCRMRTFNIGSGVGGAVALVTILVCMEPVYARAAEPLRLKQSIPLPNVEGRIDHMAVDLEN